MANLSGFDAGAVPEQDAFTVLPEGIYPAIAVASEMKPTKAGTGQYLQVVFEVLDGQYKGQKLWARMNLMNPNQTAVDIAQRELAALCRAVGVMKPSDSTELHNRPLLLTVAVEVDDRKRESNVIKKYESTSGATHAPVAAKAAAPWGGSTTGQPQAAAPAHAAKAPWQ